MKDYYESYRLVDILLDMLEKRPNKYFIVKKLSNVYVKMKIVELAVANGLAITDGEGKHKIVRITENGRLHLSAGGFVKLLGLGENCIKTSNISFKEYLNNSTNLLTIFGILNTIILFSAQKKKTDVKAFDFYNEGMHFISISMYLLSILVLFELIWTTISANAKSWKIHATYALLCSTTIGMGLLFTSQYRDLLIGIIFFGGFLGLTFMITIGLARLLMKIIRINQLPKGVIQVIFIIIMFLSSLSVKWILHYFEKQ